MGLGKTVEVLACVVAHPCHLTPSQSLSASPFPASVLTDEDDDGPSPDVCICGHTWQECDTPVWVRCSNCLRWQHAMCGGYVVSSCPPHAPYVCLPCHADTMRTAALQPSKSTLVVCPDSLLPQWQDEIKKHVKGITVAVRSTDFTLFVYRALAFVLCMAFTGPVFTVILLMQ